MNQYKITRINDAMIALTDDANLTPQALEHGTICLEHSIANLPEVQSLKSPDVVIDVGAFIGDTALIFSKNGAEVYAFEPQEDAFFCMEYNTFKNSTNISVFNEAVGNGDPVSINQDPLDGNPATRTVKLDESGKKSIRLDDFFSNFKSVDLIKIDCEGYEPPVIQGAKELIKKHKPVIICEVYPEMLAKAGFSKADIYNPLIELGYSIVTSIGEEDSVRWDITAKPLAC
jgi:FkbM family methyltransferase